jgi:hypothetical protein
MSTTPDNRTGDVEAAEFNTDEKLNEKSMFHIHFGKHVWVVF